ncbi:MAG: hypothetical protein HZT43_09640 [Exiguobacterium profundum]|nr:MAG: hypothetical protein HZT43_09640 [Exiguobacterium profundum]
MALSLSACTPFAGAYSEQAYLNATSLKARSLALVAVSDQPYSSHRDDVAEVLTDIDAAYEYARGLPRNDIVTEQWRLIRDPGASSAVSPPNGGGAASSARPSAMTMRAKSPSPSTP